MIPIAVSPALPEHRALILDSFWREYQESPPAQGVPAAVLTRKLEVLMDAPGWQTLVATPEEDAPTILGYIVCRDARTVAWVHVLRFWRGRGVARALLEQAGVSPGVVSCPFLPPHVAKVAAASGWTCRFRPYLPDVELENAARRVAAAVVG
jgi:GNAT superfamily N-acetyltransferase